MKQINLTTILFATYLCSHSGFAQEEIADEPESTPASASETPESTPAETQPQEDEDEEQNQPGVADGAAAAEGAADGNAAQKQAKTPKAASPLTKWGFEAIKILGKADCIDTALCGTIKDKEGADKCIAEIGKRKEACSKETFNVTFTMSTKPLKEAKLVEDNKRLKIQVFGGPQSVDLKAPIKAFENVSFKITKFQYIDVNETPNPPKYDIYYDLVAGNEENTYTSYGKKLTAILPHSPIKPQDPLNIDNIFGARKEGDTPLPGIKFDIESEKNITWAKLTKEEVKKDDEGKVKTDENKDKKTEEKKDKDKNMSSLLSASIMGSLMVVLFVISA